jgi:hypothetical protein
MNDAAVKQAFFSLLRAGLWKTVPDSSFDLDEEAWDRLFDMARAQTVEALVYDGILLLPPDRFPPKPLLLKWTVIVDRIEKRNARMNQSIEELNDCFTAEGVSPLLLKGQGVAACYEEPAHRLCGDVDLYFRNKEAYAKALKSVEKRNIKVSIGHDMSAEYSWKQIPVEHHNHLVDIHNPFAAGFLKELEQQEEGSKIMMPFGKEQVALPSPLLTHLSVNSHILKHSLSFGIGLRQLCDSARICYTYREQVDGEALKAVYKRLGIYRWMTLLNQLLVDFLGTPQECLPFVSEQKQDANWMMEEILAAGNFGFADSRFGGDGESASKKRKNSVRHLAHRFKLYVGYAPSEACWFPIVQLCSRIRSVTTA